MKYKRIIKMLDVEIDNYRYPGSDFIRGLQRAKELITKLKISDDVEPTEKLKKIKGGFDYDAAVQSGRKSYQSIFGDCDTIAPEARKKAEETLANCDCEFTIEFMVHKWQDDSS